MYERYVQRLVSQADVDASAQISIDIDPELIAKYNTEVPVVAVNGKVRFRGVVNPALLDRLLLAESRNPTTTHERS